MWTLDPRYWIQDSTSVDSGFRKVYFPGFLIPRYWIKDLTRVDSAFQNAYFDSGFLDLDSGFQRVGFRIPQESISWILHSTSKCFLDSEYDYLTWVTN